MPATVYPHIQLDANGVARLAGSRTKVSDIALDRIAYGWDAEEIQRQHPHFTLGQIYAALAYYCDHQSELDREIEDGRKEADELRRKLADSPAASKLRAIKAGRQQS